MKDIYLLHKTIQQESREIGLDGRGSSVLSKFGQLFTKRRLRNALISTSVVNLSQQLCGSKFIYDRTHHMWILMLDVVNVAAFYSGDFFASVLAGNNKDKLSYDSIISAMAFSFGFGRHPYVFSYGMSLKLTGVASSGAVNFFFGLPAFKTIDTLGRRKWLIWTLPFMSFFMFAGAFSFPIPWEERDNDYNTVRMVALWLYFHAAAYSPGLGTVLTP